MRPDLSFARYAEAVLRLHERCWRVGARLIQRLRRQLGLMVPVKKPKRRRCGTFTGLPTKATHPNHVWMWYLVHDSSIGSIFCSVISSTSARSANG